MSNNFFGKNMSGYMDRVTGDVGMIATDAIAKEGLPFDYALKCSPTRRVLE
jgi:hypothetical protein